jgi:hypothetical protein
MEFHRISTGFTVIGFNGIYNQPKLFEFDMTSHRGVTGMMMMMIRPFCSSN